MESLHGTHPFTIGEDGRVQVDIARKLDDDAVALFSEEGAPHIEVWPSDRYEAVSDKRQAAGLEPLPPACSVGSCGDGAIAVPESMLEVACLLAAPEKIAIGNHDHVELWDAATFESYLGSIDLLSGLFGDERA